MDRRRRDPVMAALPRHDPGSGHVGGPGPGGIGNDGQGLERAAAGRDPEFHRGESAHDQWWGDPKLLGSPAANLGPLDEPPYYAVQVHPAALGTRGGPRTDGDARVLDVDGDPIEGLYAAGNAAASMMGMTYGGAGGTLGPAVVFGYRAGRHVATR